MIAKTRGVGTFTLLLSPADFDFSRPGKVVANGRTVFDLPIKKDVGVLTRWNDRDHDRTMLFGAEVKIEVPKAQGSRLRTQARAFPSPEP